MRLGGGGGGYLNNHKLHTNVLFGSYTVFKKVFRSSLMCAVLKR